MKVKELKDYLEFLNENMDVVVEYDCGFGYLEKKALEIGNFVEASREIPDLSRENNEKEYFNPCIHIEGSHWIGSDCKIHRKFKALIIFSQER